MSLERAVLVVEGDELVCDVITVSLTEWAGTAVDCAYTGTVGLAKIRVGTYALVITDSSLREVTCFHLAGTAARRGIPVIMLSGHPVMNAKLEAVAFDYLSKPFRLSKLLAEAQVAIADPGKNLLMVNASLACLNGEKMDGHGAPKPPET